MSKSAGGFALALGALWLATRHTMRTPVIRPAGTEGDDGSAAPPAPSSGPYVATPDEYATGKLPAMRSRAAGALGRLCRAWVPVAFGPCPWELAIGATGMATGQTELVPGPLREIGFYNTPSETWRTLASSPLVRELLGRDAITPDGSAWRVAVEDQTAIGLADLLRGQRAFAGALPALAPTVPGSAWGWYVALSSWSAGAGGTAGHMRPHAAHLASVPPAQRVAAYVSDVLSDVRAGRLSDAENLTHRNAAYSALRTLQKLECARMLARSLVSSPTELDRWSPVPSPTELDPWWQQIPSLSTEESALLVRGARGRAGA